MRKFPLDDVHNIKGILCKAPLTSTESWPWILNCHKTIFSSKMTFYSVHTVSVAEFYMLV
jgi:hypothetical protein